MISPIAPIPRVLSVAAGSRSPPDSGTIRPMADWTPRRVPFDIHQVRLTREEGFVLSRCDGTLSVKDLVDMTGLGHGQILEALDKLRTVGAIADDAPRIEHVEDFSAPDIASKPLLPDDPTGQHPTIEQAEAAIALAAEEAQL